ncbi:hypothetical protein JCM5350_000885 [Sporobolomyces pararoseus]
MSRFRPVSTRSFTVQPFTFSRSFSLNSPSLSSASSSTSSSATSSTTSETTTTTTDRQIGKVSRPFRPTPLPVGPPKHRFPKPLPLSLPQTDLLKSLSHIPAIRNRPSLINDETCRDLVRGWGVDKMGSDVTVVDTYSGAGGLTRAFLELPNVGKVIAIEDAFRYNNILRDLKVEEDSKNPGRLEIIEKDSFTWEAYSEAAKHLNEVPTIPWDEKSNNHLFLAGQLPNNRHGEQLFVQLVTAIASRMWYFTRGRFSMGFVGSENYWKKIFAQPGEKDHHKLSVLLPTLAHLEYVDILSDFRPVETNFHKPRGDKAHVKAVKVIPRIRPLVNNFEALEYCAKHMFVSKAVPWPKAVAAITPGSSNLVPLLVKQGLRDLQKPVNKLTLEEWIKIADTFEDWPFRPHNLMDIWGNDEAER